MSTRWEYKVAFVDPWDRTSVEGSETRREEHERDSSFGRRFLNGMGADGWELAGIHFSMRGNAYYVFKRPMEDGAEPDLSVVKREAREQPAPDQAPPPAAGGSSEVVSL